AMSGNVGKIEYLGVASGGGRPL
ncbi:MAG: hypothetical protein QOH09_1503, partial [Pseudonocardiales bacterium]|nr:hypothetical protein [Pseudonocardiales bacterium]